jgi:uncharacterized repeat protein (TIGR03803 family)
MKTELTPTTTRRPSTVMQSAKETCRQWSPWTMALAILLGLAAAPPSAHGQTFTVLHSFKGGTDGEGPNGSVVRDAAGNLYGTTEYGGGGTCFTGDGCGTVFKVDTAGKETVLYSFTGGADGALPLASVIRDAAGNLYGTTEAGGDLTCNDGVGCGTVFKLDTDGKETVLHSFTGKDGTSPIAGVIRDAAGNLYGTTPQGGAFSSGTVFKLDTSGNETVLYNFMGGRGGTDGSYPDGALIRDAAGNLYGTTQLGGNYSFGTVFKVDSTGKETVLYRFFGGWNGRNPSGGVIMDKGGNLYGTTEVGGDSFDGTVFKLSPVGNKPVLYHFTGGADGVYPVAGVIADTAGNLYGTTQFGGGIACFGGSCGTVFKLDKTGNETVLHSFTGGADGATPVAGLVRDAAGNLYGTAYFGGDVSGSFCAGVGGCGVVFKIAP